ncbi:MAG: T9SS type A sorting domain-containing protein, partial [Candidatus Marinimicrobia bacterium]|nr:T9SS type A sorting domain-containing protein [Candidatus Neomarinimicrobiota bacterium]
YFSKCFGDDYINSTGETFPGKIELFQNYPNPFNNRTTIRFSLEAKQSIDLVIFNTLGDKVFERDLGTLSPGFNDVDWSGIDQSGNNLSSGIYLYYLKGGQNTSVRKLVLLK